MTKRRPDIVVEMNPGELAIRIAEAFLLVRRPEGQTAEVALTEMGPQASEAFLRAAEAAAIYLAECASQGRRVH